MNIPAARIYFPEADRKEILKQVEGILEGGQLTLGKYGKEFEERYAEYVGTKYAVAVNSDTSALGFSFYPTKVMTSGEGGMITTDDESIYKRALIFRDQGKAGFF